MEFSLSYQLFLVLLSKSAATAGPPGCPGSRRLTTTVPDKPPASGLARTRSATIRSVLSTTVSVLSKTPGRHKMWSSTSYD